VASELYIIDSVLHSFASCQKLNPTKQPGHTCQLLDFAIAATSLCNIKHKPQSNWCYSVNVVAINWLHGAGQNADGEFLANHATLNICFCSFCIVPSL